MMLRLLCWCMTREIRKTRDRVVYFDEWRLLSLQEQAKSGGAALQDNASDISSKLGCMIPGECHTAMRIPRNLSDYPLINLEVERPIRGDSQLCALAVRGVTQAAVTIFGARSAARPDPLLANSAELVTLTCSEK